MLQILKFDEPIPSCNIYNLKYDKQEEKWIYEYAIQTPVEITEENETDLIIYEYISDLLIRFGDGQHPDSINLHFKKLSEYLKMLEMQRLTDLFYRKQWLEKHPDAVIQDFSKKELERRDYEYNELKEIGIHAIAQKLEDNHEKDTTIFAIG